MNKAVHGPVWRRRAQPLLGTLVEVGLRSWPGAGGAGGGTGNAVRGGQECGAAIDAAIEAACSAAFAAVLDVQRCLSRFDPASDLSRFHALRPGQALRMRPATRAVLQAASALQRATGGLFDISLGTAPQGWCCEGPDLLKKDDGTRLDAGGIAKGYAVDRAVQALIDHGCAAGLVNAGGDLRAFGDIDVPVYLRDESTGGVRLFASVQQGAFATSHFSARSRAGFVSGGPGCPLRAHVSVAAPQCLWADALTKVVALSGDTSDPLLGPLTGPLSGPLLSRYQASAWRH